MDEVSSNRESDAGKKKHGDGMRKTGVAGG